MRVIIQNDYNKVSKWTASFIAKKIKDSNPTQDNPYVLGLPTGSTPLGVYNELIRLNKEGYVSFENVITFNMDEYVGIPRDHEQSYYTFMWTNFFNHIDIQEKNVNILNGNAPDLNKECLEYEEKITSVGGIDLFMGGIGPDGHIAFNEPGSSLESLTRIKTLTQDTIIANSRFFNNDVNLVPKTALTVGVKTVMSAKHVVILATGFNKALALHKVIEEGINHMWTVSALQLHRNGVVVCNDEATVEMKVGTVNYFKDIEMDNLDPKTQL
ncbi:MAG: glucosamine-6-phosphate deaminase [Spirochaetaceae bacterium]